MQLPNVKNEIRDAENEITYVVMAYRKLDYTELVQAVRVYHSGRKTKKKLKKGTTVTIMSLVGAV